MGYGNYSQEAHEALTRARADLPRERLFRQRACHPLMAPRGVVARESRDSDEHPRTLAIAFALDVTGSMGDIPELLARRELPSFMRLLGACRVPDPQVLFLAVGDAASDAAPLQVGQFESTAELIDRWLTLTYLEGGGGGGGRESYELALYFLAAHTRLDCLERRGRRGYLFMTGDELPYPAVSRRQVDDVLGDGLDADVPTEAAVAAVSAAYHPFFLVPDRARRARCEARWRELLGDHVVCLEAPADACAAAAGLVALTEGSAADLDALAAVLRADGAPRERAAAVVRALTPYAATLGRDGAPEPPLDEAPPPPPAGPGARPPAGAP
jgi:hypothetical protein